MMEDGETSPAGRGRRLAVALACLLVAAACSNDSVDVALLDDPVPSATDEQTGSTAGGGAGSTPAEGNEAEGDTGGEEAAPDGESVRRASNIRVDQFGYRPGDPKIAVIADPEVGFDAELDLQLGGTIELRRFDDDEVVFAGEPEPWGGGEIHEQSGDRGWWFDFSSVDQIGTYYLADPGSGLASGPFDIDPAVYDDVLDAALRMFWYNRGNIDHPPELAGPWNDGPAFVRPQQDTEARSVDDQDNPATALDLSGGWFDAGDPNKYVTFAAEPVHGLLTIYRRFPQLFDDDLGITESGNGIPDIVDEVKWETDWLERMQLDDGSVLTKVGLLGFESDPIPSQAVRPRFYEEACSSATIAAAGMFANAALVFADLPPLAGDAERLERRAVDAWNWYQDNPRRDDCDTTEVKAGDADLPLEVQDQMETLAAIYLFALTGEQRYNAEVSRDHAGMRPFDGEGFGHYGPNQGDALLFYRNLDGADPVVAEAIEARVGELNRWSALVGFEPDSDLYRSYMPDNLYHWGSNRVKANVGAVNLLVDGIPGGEERALGHLHYFHGVNPLGLVYLSNMEDLGAEYSAQHLFHHWFGDRSDFDVNRNPDLGVPPGYVTGGPNVFYGGDVAPPAGQPPQKSYADWAAYDSDPAWEITEPAIYYQSAYLRLLAAALGS